MREIELEKTPKMLWGWTCYKSLGWVSDDLKLYDGYFKSFGSSKEIESKRISFWTNRPTFAMREICNRLSSGEVVMSYEIFRYKKAKNKGKKEKTGGRAK